jgi:Terminase RNaseH-like domain
MSVKTNSKTKHKPNSDKVDKELELIITGKKGVIEWGKVFLPHYFNVLPADFHYDMTQTAEDNLRVAIASPRDHAKSTLLTLCYVLFRMCVYKEPYTTIVSDTYDQACEHIGNIFSELATNEELKTVYPHVNLQNYSTKAKVRTKRRESDFITVGDLRVRAFGAGMKVRGRRHKQHRPTLCILDDLENDVDVENPDSRQKLWNWFVGALIPAIARLGKIIIVGTILHADSVLSRLMLGKISSFKTKFYSAIMPNGKCLWPARWSLQSLKERRQEVGTNAFSKEYLNKPVNDMNSLFKQPWVEENRINKEDYKKIEKSIFRIVVAVDPSVSDNPESDECGIVVCAISRDGYNKLKYYILEDLSLKASPKVWARVVLDAYTRWEANTIVVEVNNGGDLIAATIEAALEENEYLPHIEAVRASRGKAIRAEPIAVLYENNLVYHVGEYDKLEFQMFNWKQGNKSPDRMDAMVWGLTLLLNESSYSDSSPVVVEEITEFEENPYMNALTKLELLERAA